jgi:hypothetical protein
LARLCLEPCVHEYRIGDDTPSFKA